MQQSLFLLETKSSAASTSKTVNEKTATIAVEGTSAETSHQHKLCKSHIISMLFLIIYNNFTVNNFTVLYTARSDLRRVVMALLPYSDWRGLGFVLGLDCQTLDTIQQNNPGEKEAACRMYMLKSWLDGEDEVTRYGGPSWQQLVDSLRKLGQDALAQNIEQEIYRE